MRTLLPKVVATGLSLVGLSGSTLAQAPLNIPTGQPPGSSTSFPFNESQARKIIYLYGANNFLNQGITGPVLITRLRARPTPTSGTFAGSSINSLRCNLSTAQVDIGSLPSISSSSPLPYSSVIGSDSQDIYNGSLGIAGFDGSLTPGGIREPFVIDIDSLSTGGGGQGFVYDPNAGDLCIYLESDGVLDNSQTNSIEVATSAGAPILRLFDTTAPNSNSATNSQVAAIAFELEYTAALLIPDFDADVTSGPSPLTVTFTDRTVSYDPSAPPSVRYDFDGDFVFDATLRPGQTTTFTYPCGLFTPRLEATNSFGQVTVTSDVSIDVDPLNIRIINESTDIGTGTPVPVQAVAPASATLSWDFDQDGIEDASGASPVFSYTTPGNYTVTLTGSLGCRTATATTQFQVFSNAILTPRSGNSFQFNTSGTTAYVDVDVTNPGGVIVDGIYHRTNNPNTLCELEVYRLNPPLTTTLGNNSQSDYTLIASGSAVSPGTIQQPFLVLIPDFALLSGIHGLAIVVRAGGQTTFEQSIGQQAVGNDLTLTQTGASSTLFAAPSTSFQDAWGGGLGYQAVDRLTARFSANVTSGLSPLSVQFTDESLTIPGRSILTRSWDLDGDGVFDSNASNPTFTYTTCGDFDVTLVVLDIDPVTFQIGSAALTKQNFIQPDLLQTDFKVSAEITARTNPVSCTYTGTPGAQNSWDFDGDGIADAIGDNPSFIYSSAGLFTITLTSSLSCRTEVATAEIRIVDRLLDAPPGPSGNFTSFTTSPDVAYLDLNVTDPGGITVTAMGARSPRSGELHGYEVWGILNGSVVDNFASSNFILLGQGQFTPAAADELTFVDVSDFSLPLGTHGLAVVHRDVGGSDAGHTWYAGNGGLTSGNSDIVITPRGSDTNFDTQVSNTAIGSTSNSFAGAVYYRLGGSLPVQGTVQQFANGCPGSLGTVTLTPDPDPILGAAYTIRADNVQGAAIMHVGLSNQAAPSIGLPLPFALRPIFGTAPECTWYVSREFLFPIALPNASNQVSVTFPANPGASPAFIGLPLYLQAFVFDNGAQGGVVSSDAWFAVVEP